jgi:glycopeptide antibiotics resistance protein
MDSTQVQLELYFYSELSEIILNTCGGIAGVILVSLFIYFIFLRPDNE